MGSGFRTFQSGEVLTSSNVQNFLMDQAVMVFAGTAARGSAIASPETGMLTYRTDGTADSGREGFEFYNGSAYTKLIQPSGILQVVSTVKTDSFTTTSGTFTDVTGLSVSITPSSASSKVLVLATISGSAQVGVTALFINLVRDSTNILLGDAAGSRTRTTDMIMSPDTGTNSTVPIVYLDSPNTTSATTYKIQVRAGAAGSTVAVNRSVLDTDTAVIARTTSTITVLEVSA